MDAQTPAATAAAATRDALRARAEQALDGAPLDPAFAVEVPADASRMIHELQVHQIELEMQYDELLRSRGEIESERARYRDLYDLAPTGHVSLARNGTILEANLTTAKLFGRDRQSLIGTRFGYAVMESDRPMFNDILEHAFTSGERQECEITLLDAQLTPRVVQITTAPEPSVSECRLGLVDVTTRRRTDELLREREIELQQSRRMETVGRLAGGIAHDFNNQLTIINGYADELLNELPADDPHRDIIHEIGMAGTRAAALTKQLLTFSRTQVFDVSLLDVNAVVQQVDRLLRRVIGDDIALRTTLAMSAGLVRVNAHQLEQVLINLAMNARDAMPTGGMLSVTTAVVEPDAIMREAHFELSARCYVLLTVTDTGQGMDAVTAGRAFEPFFTTKAVGRGTGLGLSIAYGIVRQFDGCITVNSVPNRGTTVSIYLPLAPTDTMTDSLLIAPASEVLSAPLAPVPTPSPTLRSGASTGAATETVLIVEDDHPVLAFAGRLLRLHGYRVLVAAGAAEALAVAEAFDGEIDLLITDVIMPSMNGYELAVRLQLRRPDLHVVYMSGAGADQLLSRGIDRDHVPFLEKPFLPSVLARKVREALGTKARLQALTLPA